MNMKKVESLKELREELEKVSTYASDDTRFTAKAVLFIAEQLDKLIKVTRRTGRKPQKPSKYNLFVGKMVKRGLTFKQAAKEWKKRKR